MYIPVISDVFGWLFKLFYGFSQQNYLITLFLFAVVMKIVLLPFGIKQQKNSIKQARLRPKEMAIRNKYKGRNDKATQQKLSEEIMKLYQEENVNPMSGCLPMLIQLPVLFALYNVIINPITYISSYADSADALTKAYRLALDLGDKVHVAQIDIIREISKAPEKLAAHFSGEGFAQISEELSGIGQSFNIFGIDLIEHANFTWPLILIPILTFVFAFASTKIIRKFTYQPTTGDASTQASMGMMDWMMPLLSVYISFQFAAAIAVYWMFQNILSAAQQILLCKLYPVPQVTEEQIKEAELQLKGKSKQHKEKKNVVVDDYVVDDYDKTTETDKSGGNNKKKEGVMSTRKAGISSKVRKIYAEGRRLTARKKI